MLNVTVELFLSEYYLVRFVMGKYFEDRKRLFQRLSKIFFIGEAEAERLYALSENEVAAAINTETEFMQHQRIRKYNLLVGSEIQLNTEWEEAVRIKGNAILAAQKDGLVPEADATRNAVYEKLSSAAAGGLISALRILGILQCEGIFLNKNCKSGIKNLTKAADWNDIVSTLSILSYSEDARKYNIARLRVEVADTPFETLYTLASKEYSEEGTYVGEAALLKKAFSSGILKQEIYEPAYARVINGKGLCFKDREKIVFARNKELVSAVGDLPIKMTCGNTSNFDLSAMNVVALKRKSESEAIIRALNNSDLRALPSFRPLCLCCNSIYVLKMYADAIFINSGRVNTEIIDVAELTAYDLEPTPNNIFVRGLDEDKDNRLFLYFSGDIAQGKIDAACNILQSERRARFHLNSPNLTLNLSAVLPVCFSDEKNARLLKPYCDVVEIKEVTEDEKRILLQKIIGRAESAYSVSVQLKGDVLNVFEGYDVDTAEKIINSFVRVNRGKGADISISRDTVSKYSDNERRAVIGFGGEKNVFQHH